MKTPKIFPINASWLSLGSVNGNRDAFCQRISTSADWADTFSQPAPASAAAVSAAQASAAVTQASAAVAQASAAVALPAVAVPDVPQAPAGVPASRLWVLASVAAEALSA
jgi:hypothetical protein